MRKISRFRQARYLLILAVAAGAGALGGKSRPRPGANGPSELRVLCAGGSQTVGMTPGQSFPEQLDRLLQTGHRGRKASVTSVARPGEHADEILAELPKQLAREKPHWVVLMLGKYSDPGWERLGASREAGIAAGLAKAVALIRAAGAQPILQTQPLHRQPLGEDLADPFVRAAAVKEGVPLADLSGRLARLHKDGPLEPYYFPRSDGGADPDHLGERGNRVAAEQLARLVNGEPPLETAPAAFGAK